MTLQFPEFEPKLQSIDGKPQIWCLVRKKWVAFTKEEWVRQNWLNYLISVLQYPSSLMVVEKEIRLGELKKRIDILVYQNSLPFMLIECKEQDIHLSEQTIQQILSYQTVVQSGILVISNGHDTRAFSIKDQRILALDQLPFFK
jgi:hypothetical protein